MRRRLLYLSPLLLLFCIFDGCGPSEKQAGSGVLCAAPVVLIGVYLALWLLRWVLLRKSPARLPMQGGVWLRVFFYSLAGPILAWLFGDIEEGTYWGYVWLFGTSTLTLVLVVWCIWIAASPKTVFTWSFVPVFIVMVAPAIPMTLGLTERWLDVMMYIWLIPGYGGYLTAPLYLLLLLGAWFFYPSGE